MKARRKIAVAAWTMYAAFACGLSAAQDAPDPNPRHLLTVEIQDNSKGTPCALKETPMKVGDFAQEMSASSSNERGSSAIHIRAQRALGNEYVVKLDVRCAIGDTVYSSSPSGRVAVGSTLKVAAIKNSDPIMDATVLVTVRDLVGP